jgi:hypothetical protein
MGFNPAMFVIRKIAAVPARTGPYLLSDVLATVTAVLFV